MALIKFKQIYKKKSVLVGLVVLVFFLVLYLINMLYLSFKDYPGYSYYGEIYNISDEDIDFIYDVTYKNESEQMIFSSLFNSMKDANKFIIADMFLLNDNHKNDESFYSLTEGLIKAFSFNKDIERILITDPINTFYGSHDSRPLEALEKEGVKIFLTDLSKLRQSNKIWSSIYYPFMSMIPVNGKGSINHPFGDPNQKVTIRSFLRLLNFKANHRKIAVMDYNDSYISFILSANPHDPSSRHSNIGFAIKGQIAKDVLISESNFIDFVAPNISESFEEGDIKAQLLTEVAIRDSIIKDIDLTNRGDSINVAVFYLSDRKMINSIKRAAKRGVIINMVLDPNKDAFGFEKNGIPNRQVAYELMNYDNINIRWYDTHGEQFHTKIVVIRKSEIIIVYGGSANYTKRNLGGYNLETNVKIIAPIESNFSKDIFDYFEKINPNTLDYDSYMDNSIIKYVVYRIQESLGLCSF